MAAMVSVWVTVVAASLFLVVFAVVVSHIQYTNTILTD